MGEKPFLEINLGPTVVKDQASVDSVNIFTFPFQKIDWQNIAIVATIGGLTLDSFGKTQALTLEGNINLEYAEISNVNLTAEKFSATDAGSTYSADFIRSDISDLNFYTALAEQFFSGTTVVEGIVVSEPLITVPEAIVETFVKQGVRNLNIDIDDVKILEFGGYVENVKLMESSTN